MCSKSRDYLKFLFFLDLGNPPDLRIVKLNWNGLRCVEKEINSLGTRLANTNAPDHPSKGTGFSVLVQSVKTQVLLPHNTGCNLAMKGLDLINHIGI